MNSRDDISIAFTNLREEVAANQNVPTVPMRKLRDAVGTRQLGSDEVKCIASNLWGQDIGHYPETLPTSHKDWVRLYALNSHVATLIRWVVHPCCERDHDLWKLSEGLTDENTLTHASDSSAYPHLASLSIVPQEVSSKLSSAAVPPSGRRESTFIKAARTELQRSSYALAADDIYYTALEDGLISQRSGLTPVATLQSKLYGRAKAPDAEFGHFREDGRTYWYLTT